MAGTGEPDRQRRMSLGLLAGFIALIVGLATTFFIVLLLMLNCGMSPPTYEGWGCRAGRLYWPPVLFVIALAWIMGLGLVLVFLLRTPPNRASILGDSDDNDFWEWWRSESE